MNQFQKDMARWVENTIDNDHYSKIIVRARQEAQEDGEDRCAGDLTKLLKKRFNFIRNCETTIEIEIKEKKS